ncbi:MAG: alpha-ribazole phosphatase family protein [Candidatus Lokiarchaeota archaeon]|nr:alpha-ribazole phosphatase family protein [Candidatus Lokiarchaeota archaeon]
MDVLIVRHTKVNSPIDVLYGSHDVELAPSFLEEAKEVKQRLYHWFPFDIVYSSPLTRALKLAKYLQGDNVIIDDRLREINFGPEWEMKKWADLPDFTDWFLNQAVPPNGESYVDLSNRIKQFYDELFEQRPGEKILITAHAGVIRCTISLYTGVPLRNMFYFHVKYGGALHLKLEEYPEQYYRELPSILLPKISVHGFNL